MEFILLYFEKPYTNPRITDENFGRKIVGRWICENIKYIFTISARAYQGLNKKADEF